MTERRWGVPVAMNENLTTLRPIVTMIEDLLVERGFNIRTRPVITYDNKQYYDIRAMRSTLAFGVFQNGVMCWGLGGLGTLKLMDHGDPEQFNKIEEIIRSHACPS